MAKKNKRTAPQMAEPAKVEPAHALTRDELEEFYALMKDTETMKEFDDAISSKNLLPDERDMILDWAFSAYNNNALEAEQKLKDIAVRVENIPIAQPKEDLEGLSRAELQELLTQWEKTRSEIFGKIEEMSQARDSAQKAVDSLEKAIAEREKQAEKVIKATPYLSKSAQDMIRADSHAELSEELKEKRMELHKASINYDVQSLIGAHARDAKAQIDSLIKEMDRESRKQWIKDKLEKTAELANKAVQRVGRETKELAQIPAMSAANIKLAIEDSRIGGRRDTKAIEKVKDKFKDYNQECKELRSKEQELIKAAQRIADKEHAKSQPFDFGRFWGRGKEHDGSKPEQITSLERAKELISKNTHFYNLHLKSLQSEVKKQEKDVEKSKEKLDKAIKKLEDRAFKHRQKVKEIGDKFLDKEEQGLLGKVSLNAKATMNQRINDILNETQMGSFDEDLKKYLKDNQHGHLIKGEDIEFRTPEVDPFEEEFLEELDLESLSLEENADLENNGLDGIETAELDGIETKDQDVAHNGNELDGQTIMEGFDEIDAPEIDEQDGPVIGG